MTLNLTSSYSLLHLHPQCDPDPQVRRNNNRRVALERAFKTLDHRNEGWVKKGVILMVLQNMRPHYTPAKVSFGLNHIAAPLRHILLRH